MYIIKYPNYNLSSVLAVQEGAERVVCCYTAVGKLSNATEVSVLITALFQAAPKLFPFGITTKRI